MKTKTVYLLDPATGELCGECTAYESPVEPGTFITPVDSTDVMPPSPQPGKARVFSAGAWALVKDLRGAPAYDVTTGAETIVDTLGVLPKTLTLVAPPAVEAAKLIALKSAEILAVDTFHAEVVRMLAGNPTQVEIDTWAMKLATADAIASGAQVALVGQSFLTAAGLTTPALQSAWASAVHAKASAYADIVGTAEAIRSAAKAAISSASTQTALSAAVTANRAAADTAVVAAKAKLGIV